MSRHSRLLGLAALALATLAAFSSALGNGFIRRDDFTYIRLGANRSLAQLFTSWDYFHYCPLPLLTLGAEHSLVGMHPFLYHLDNVLLHAANSVLVVLLLERLLRGRFGVALLAGALFALHPLHVESVAWVAERKDVLSTFFFLLSLLAYLRYGDRPRGRWYALALGLYALSLLSKSMAITAPFVMWLTDWLRRRPLGAVMVLEKLPFLALAAGAGAINMLAQSPDVASSTAYRGHIWYDDLGVFGRLWTGVESLAFYTGKLVWPSGLSGHYEVGLVGVGPFAWTVSVAVVLAIAVFAWRAADLRREVLWGVLFFLITIAPVIKVMPFGGRSIFNDRYTYLPSLGLFLVAALPFRHLARWAPPRRAAALAGCALALALLGVASFERAKVWRTSETFWADAVAKNPGSAYARNFLARYYLDYTEQYDRAVTVLEEATRIDPTYGESWANLGVAFEKQGRPDEAESLYLRAIEVDPADPILRFLAGAYYQRVERPHEAIEQYRKVLELYPRAAQAHADIGRCYLQMGQSGRARKAFEEALALDPEQPSAHVGLALLYAEQHQYQKAEHHLRAGMRGGAPASPQLVRRIRAGLRRANAS